jgi:chaperone modulatory protein CbpM
MWRMADLVATISALQRSDLEAWIREELVVPRKETSALIEKERSVAAQQRCSIGA